MYARNDINILKKGITQESLIRVHALRRRVSARRDESQGMHLMREAFTAKVLRDTAIEDGKNEIQFAQAAAAAPLFDADLRCKMKNEITRRRVEELVPFSFSLCPKLICAGRRINVGDLIPLLLGESHATLINVNSENDSKVIEKKRTTVCTNFSRGVFRASKNERSRTNVENAFL